jgi:hypothetical protein
VKDATPRAFSPTRAAYGAVLLCAPGAVISRCTGQPASTRARAVVRVLGSRHLVQAAMTVRAPSALVLRAGAQVDLALGLAEQPGSEDRPVLFAPLGEKSDGSSAKAMVSPIQAARDFQAATASRPCSPQVLYPSALLPGTREVSAVQGAQPQT